MTTAAGYLSAHADDWQLFMTPSAADDLRAAGPTHRVTFVHLTAGDDGFDRDFWTAREIGAVNSILYGLGRAAQGAPTPTWTEAAGHPVATYVVTDHVDAHFLRLPDGNMDGSGYETTDGQSLTAMLTRGRALTTLGDETLGDRRTSYRDLEDLAAAVASLLERAIAGTTSAVVHHLDGMLPHVLPEGHSEHADHLATAAVAEAALRRTSDCVVRTYLDYDTSLHPANVDGDALRVKTGMFYAYNFFARVASGDRYPVTALDPTYQAWLPRQIVTSDGASSPG